MRALILIGILLIPTLGHAAVTVDAVTSGEAMNAGDIGFSHIGAADATLALACITERDTTLSIGAGPSATYGGNAMTLVPGATQTQATRLKTSLFYYVSPPSGSQAFSVTKSTNANRSIATVVTLKGTATTSIFNPAGTNGADSGTNLDVDGLASAVGEFAVLCGQQSTNAPVVSADATAPVSTELTEVDHSDGTGLTHFMYTEDGAATSINMRVDSDTSIYWSAVAVSIRAATGNSFGPLRRRH